MNFILYGKSLEKLIFILVYINIILNNSIPKDKNTTKRKYESFENFVIYFYSFISVIFIYFFIEKYHHNIFIWIIFIWLLTSIIKILHNIKNNSMKLSVDIKKTYTFFSILMCGFLSANMTNNYINALVSLPHLTKEILLLIYLTSKMIIYLFIILVDISILISNLRIELDFLFQFISKRLYSIVNKKIKTRWYNYKLYNKEKKKNNLIIDKIIYFISFPFYFLYNVINIVINYIIIWIAKLILNIANKLSEFDDNRKKVISRILRIALIISLCVVYIICIYNKKIFSNELIEIYSMLSTVILIPLIYDSIKANRILTNK